MSFFLCWTFTVEIDLQFPYRTPQQLYNNSFPVHSFSSMWKTKEKMSKLSGSSLTPMKSTLKSSQQCRRSVSFICFNGRTDESPSPWSKMWCRASPIDHLSNPYASEIQQHLSRSLKQVCIWQTNDFANIFHLTSRCEKCLFLNIFSQNTCKIIKNPSCDGISIKAIKTLLLP